jgi:hypothetical protein
MRKGGFIMSDAANLLAGEASESARVEEIEYLRSLIRRRPEYLSTDWMIAAYASLGREVLADPFDSSVSRHLIDALRARKPFSVIRLGDGEMNILAWGTDPQTPSLDRFSIKAIVAGQEDSFVPDELWSVVLRELMISAVLQADVVGVLGLWRPSKHIGLAGFLALLKKNPRGCSGQWRGLDYMLRWGQTGILRDKIVASAHLYFGVLRHLDEIISHAERIFLITSHVGVAEKLRVKFPTRHFEHIPVGRARGRPNPGPVSGPQFLLWTAAELPLDLRGCCCLVGAGPWAEFYCTWIKQRGGVAVDIGSGFDLLAGSVSRPVHRALGSMETDHYAL